MCGGVFDDTWTTEEAMDECKSTFGEKITESDDLVVVCDDCYKKTMSEQNSNFFVEFEKKLREIIKTHENNGSK